MVKKTDYWWTVIVVDPIAVRVVRPLVPISWITPTGLTVAAQLLGVVSAVLFGFGALVPAAILFEVRFVLDCLDGKLARLRGTSSAAGAYLDYIGDVLLVTANLLGLGYWLHTETSMPFLVLVALPVTFVAQVAVLKSASPFGEIGFSDALPGGYRGWMASHRLHPVPGRVDAENGLLFVLPIVAVAIGRDEPLVWGAGLATAGFGYLTLRLAWKGLQVARASDAARAEAQG